MVSWAIHEEHNPRILKFLFAGVRDPSSPKPADSRYKETAGIEAPS